MTLLRPAVLLLALAPAVLAQGGVQGTVRDAVSNRPLIGAIVTLRSGEEQRVTRTDDGGAFAFRVPAGPYTLRVQRLGYEPVERMVAAATPVEPITVAMSRVQQLDTVRVRAARQAIYGVVGTDALQPLPGSTVQIFGASQGKTVADSSGRFFFDIRTPGVYLIRASAKGYASGTVSVTLPPNDGVEVALLLDTATASSHWLEHVFADFNERLIRLRPNRSTLVPRNELTRHPGSAMLSAIRASPSFAKKAFRFGPEACVFVDGRPKPGVSLQAFDPADVEMVEVYIQAGDASGTLTLAWPRNAPCGDTGAPSRITKGPDIVQYVSIWLKR